MAKDYNKMTLVELNELVKKNGLKLRSGLKKAEIIAALEDADKTAEKTAEITAEITAARVKPAQMKETAKSRTKNAETVKTPEKAENAGKPKAVKTPENAVNAGKPKTVKTPEKAVKPEDEGQAVPEKKRRGRPPKEHEGIEGRQQEVEKPAEPAKSADVTESKPAVPRPITAEQRQNPEPRPTTEQRQNPEPRPTGEGNGQSQANGPANIKEGILEIMPDGFGFIRCDNFLPGPDDVYVSPTQIRRMNLKTGDMINGIVKDKTGTEKFNALLYVNTVNGLGVGDAIHRKRFEDLTPVFPFERINLETPGCPVAMRMVNLLSPIGKGQRGMIVSQPKAGKTTLLKQAAKAIKANHPEIHIIVLLIDERPEEVTDMKESIEGENVEVIYSTFDELPDNHKRVSEMVIERAKRLVEHKRDVVILLDSITRLARAYNLTCMSSGRTLSGGLDPAALYMPKRFFGAARKMREGGSLTILATALVETGSRMDDVVFEEFKGTGNMELVLDRNLSERRIFPAIDLPKSSTRREDLLLTPAEMEANYLMRKALNGARSEDAIERIIQLFSQTKTNAEFVEYVRKYGVLRVQPNNI